MALNAEITKSDPADDGALRWVFEVVGEKETKTLAAAFARAVLPRLPAADGQRLRIGLSSNSMSTVGKSVFAAGMLETVADKVSLEEAEIVFSGPQNLWRSGAAGWIRHYDCGIGAEKGMLPSYRDNDLSQCGLPLTDIAEHPHCDRNDKGFDAIVFFKNGISGPESRILTFAATPDLARTQGFRGFLKKAAPLLLPPRPARRFTL